MNLRRKLTENVKESKRFVWFVAHHFIEDDCPYRASALAFATLIAVVPFVAVSLAILSTLSFSQNLVGPLQEFIFANFVPSTGQIIQDYLQLLASQATKLSSIAMVFLIVVALLVMYTIEHTMNQIWRVPQSRQGIVAFLLYSSIVSSAPLLLALSIAASSYFASLPFIVDHDIPALLNYLPFLFSLAGFTFLYTVVPNCQVRFMHGFLGAIFATILFESAKFAFAYYLTNYNIYFMLYGPFATVPIFLVWIYWVWFISLLGAEVSYALSVKDR
jgi:membrane protein